MDTPVKQSVITSNAVNVLNTAKNTLNNVKTAANNTVNTTNTIKNSIQNKVTNTVNVVKTKIKTVEAGQALIILLVLLAIVYFLYSISYTYRVGNILNTMDTWVDYLEINPRYIIDKKLTSKPLRDFYVASAFRPYVAKYQMMDYCSLEILEKTIACGPRMLYIDIFNDSLQETANPVVSVGYEKGNWKLTLNTLPFDDVCKTIANTAFRSGYVDNYYDPLFLVLNLNLNNNLYSTNKVQESIIKYFKPRLLESRYSNADPNVNMGNVKIGELMEKVIIICSDGYQNTKLEELVNSSWVNDNINHIPFDTLGGNLGIENSETLQLDADELTSFNSRFLSIVHPPNNSFYTYTYPDFRFYETGCQFVCMNYNKVDDNTIQYVERFRMSSFILHL